MLPKCSDCRRLNLVCVQSNSSVKESKNPTAIPFSETTSSTSLSKPEKELGGNLEFWTASSSSTSSRQSQILPIGDLEGDLDAPISDHLQCIDSWEQIDTDIGAWLEEAEAICAEVIEPVTESLQSDLGTTIDVVTDNSFLENCAAIGDSIDSTLFLQTMQQIPPSISLMPVCGLSNRSDKHLFQHFNRVVVNSLCIAPVDEENPFLRLVTPLAAESTAVMRSLLALSACHIKHNGGYPDVVQRGLNHQTKALSALNQAIQSGENKESTLAAVLLLGLLDIRDGDSTGWSWHIKAAKSLIATLSTSPNETTRAWPFLLDLFEYMDSISTITRSGPPLIEYEIQRCGDALFAPCSPVLSSTQNYNAMFGFARVIYRLVGQVSALARRRKYRINEAFELQFRNTAAKIESNIRAWMPNGAVVSGDAEASSMGKLEVANCYHAALAIKWAALLRLHQVVEGYELPNPICDDSLCNILENLQHIRIGSSVDSSLIFPLFMAGTVCLSKEDRMTIRCRWRVLERTVGFKNVEQIGHMLEKIWDTMDTQIAQKGSASNHPTVNWVEMRWLDFPGLIIF
ncbi:hypothetical protein BP6252_05995 [Coleophoma cylindrospora]|uniref:Uncharacterized protein n=1 Tax=Coleophoma cylindrospora TaxID=1849047 RepID=A0A3D8RLD3_9HELO|nr:hypothetical protein BP6252_05995 [Coleophoma cylindrospora]